MKCSYNKLTRLFRGGCVLILLILVSAVGCQKKVELGGTVVFSDDLSPVPTGTVMFETDTYLAKAPINPDGTFTVRAENGNTGLLTGKYKVYVRASKETGKMDSSGHPTYEPLIDEKHSSYRATDIVISVTEATQSIDLKVDRYKK